jgi:TonB family protein
LIFRFSFPPNAAASLSGQSPALTFRVMRAAPFVLLIACAMFVASATIVEAVDPMITVDMKAADKPEYAPLPSYPKEARLHSWGGFALYELHVQFNGKVAYVFVRISTGHPVLDEAGKAALAQWSWHGGRYRLLAIPMNFNPGSPPPRPRPSAGEPRNTCVAPRGNANFAYRSVVPSSFTGHLSTAEPARIKL